MSKSLKVYFSLLIIQSFFFELRIIEDLLTTFYIGDNFTYYHVGLNFIVAGMTIYCIDWFKKEINKY